MVLWNFDLVWKNLWYYTENYRTLIYVGKNMVDYQNLETLIYNEKKTI